MKQRIAEEVVHEPQSRQETVELVRMVPRERVQQHTAEQGVPQPREEAVEAVRSIPCEQQAVERMVDMSTTQNWGRKCRGSSSGANLNLFHKFRRAFVN